jgi:hypothetical protein
MLLFQPTLNEESSLVGWATGLVLPTNPPFCATQLLVTPQLVSMVKR